MYKLIAFDMDGTLLNSQKQISPKTLEAVNKAIECGKEVVISSGRGLPELYDILTVLPNIRYIIMTSGACVYDYKEKKAIYSNLLSTNLVHKIIDATKDRDILIHILDEIAIMDQDQGRRVKDYGMGVYQPMYDKVCTFVESIEDYYNTHEQPIQKINLYHKTPEDRKETYQRLKDLPLALKMAEAGSLECSAQGINKGTGIKKLCEHLGITIEETIGVGDADNDTEMLETVGLAIAMGNANEHIKSICDVIVSDNDHDGCKEAIEEYLLKE